jgi:SAM-dependent methyltransferase
MRPIRSLRLRAADAADRALGRRDPLTPPRRRLDFVGDSDFQATGEEFLGYFRELADFKPTDRVLDVGCGIGRMARVLAAELRPPGSYDGFDIVADAISWCARHYRDMPVPFAFAHADLHNTRYNPAGRCSPAEYRFPYEDGAFDLVIATSVFTHLLSDEADNYLREVAGVLCWRAFSSLAEVA